MLNTRKKKFLILSLIISVISGITAFGNNKNLAQEATPPDKKEKPMPAGVTCYLMGPVNKTVPENDEIEESIRMLKIFYAQDRILKTTYLSSLKQKLHLATVINKENPFYKDYFNNLINNEISLLYEEIDSKTYERRRSLFRAEKNYYENYRNLDYIDNRIEELENQRSKNIINQEEYEKKKTEILQDLIIYGVPGYNRLDDYSD
jgi:hemoglobin-like flavoprotein